jgi:hypothetical protein
MPNHSKRATWKHERIRISPKPRTPTNVTSLTSAAKCFSLSPKERAGVRGKSV